MNNKKDKSAPWYVRLLLNMILIGILVFGISFVYQKGFDLSYGIVTSQSGKERDTQIKEVKIQVDKGDSTEDIAQAVYAGGLITNKFWFRAQSKLLKFDGKYQQGIFSLNTAMDDKQIMEALTTDPALERTEIKVTIPEGFNIAQIANRLEEQDIVTRAEFLAAVNEKEYDYDFLSDMDPNKKNKLEGYLFPDTYFFEEGVSAEGVVIKMLNRFEEITNQYKAKLIDSEYSLDDIIIIASIIEQEAKLAEERPIISGVIHNRIEDAMKLQMCSTVQYALEKKKANLSYNDLKVESPYNTYKYSGLPIAPICSPGEDSIKAALYPDEHDYFFFVVKDPEVGSHAFSVTAAEHNASKAQYKDAIDKNFHE